MIASPIKLALCIDRLIMSDVRRQLLGNQGEGRIR
jgi:hypothetical protein